MCARRTIARRKTAAAKVTSLLLPRFFTPSLRYGPPQHTLEADVAVLRFDLDVDLRQVWNWNVKMLFVYITAEYATPEHVRPACRHHRPTRTFRVLTALDCDCSP